jgi:[ribosomal protein S5]-alanine N-acetyltransferase
MTHMDLHTPTLHTDRLRLRAFDDADADALYAMQSSAFVHEGTLRQDCVVNGDVSHSWVYGLIRSDWSSETTCTG